MSGHSEVGTTEQVAGQETTKVIAELQYREWLQQYAAHHVTGSEGTVSPRLRFTISFR